MPLNKRNQSIYSDGDQVIVTSVRVDQYETTKYLYSPEKSSNFCEKCTPQRIVFFRQSLWDPVR